MNSVWLYRGLAILLLAGIGGQRYATIRKPEGVEQYHAHIREAAKLVPGRIGSWVGENVAVPAQAIRVLDPNVILSRRYVNVENGVSAGLLFVHCSDAHDMAGHFPLRCYPAAGWDLKASRPMDWQLGDLRLTGTEYEFWTNSLEGVRGERSIVVANCLLRPGGMVLRDMNSMTRSVVGAGGQSSGAGQIQVYFDAGIPAAQRDEAIVTLVGGYRPVLDAVLADPLPAQGMNR